MMVIIPIFMLLMIFLIKIKFIKIPIQFIPDFETDKNNIFKYKCQELI